MREKSIGQWCNVWLAQQAADEVQQAALVKPIRTYIAAKAQGTGRLEGPICGAMHRFEERTPGRQDACWYGPHCRHLDTDVWVFVSRKAAERAAGKDRLP